MRLHETVIEKLVKILENYGGYREQTKLKDQLRMIDLTLYERQSGNKENILVLTEDMQKLTNKVNS